METFPLGIFPEAILPFVIGFLADAANAAGDITATEEASLLETSGPRHEERLQGGLFADGACVVGLVQQRFTEIVGKQAVHSRQAVEFEDRCILVLKLFSTLFLAED